jgi:heme/copper-type cytochrome/quinol oxidase subunit 1
MDIPLTYDDHKPRGWRRWVYATNHKDIGTMYLVFSCVMFFIGGSFATLMRLELFQRKLDDPATDRRARHGPAAAQ